MPADQQRDHQPIDDRLLPRRNFIRRRRLIHRVRVYLDGVTRPKKKWGQNFLRNRGAVERIVAAVEPEPGELIVEIGPGEGVLTEKLIAFPNEILAIEIDPELADRLRTRFGSRVEVINDDALEFPLPTRPWRAVGNLPYNVATPIIRRVVTAE